jgi:hypothetical protein
VLRLEYFILVCEEGGDGGCSRNPLMQLLGEALCPQSFYPRIMKVAVKADICQGSVNLASKVCHPEQRTSGFKLRVQAACVVESQNQDRAH